MWTVGRKAPPDGAAQRYTARGRSCGAAGGRVPARGEARGRFRSLPFRRLCPRPTTTRGGARPRASGYDNLRKTSGGLCTINLMIMSFGRGGDAVVLGTGRGRGERGSCRRLMSPRAPVVVPRLVPRRRYRGPKLAI